MRKINQKIKTITIFSVIIILYWLILPSLSFRVITILLVFGIAWLEQRRVKKVYIDIEIDSLPDAFIDYKIALATDIHCDRFNRYYFAHKTYEMLEDEQYDICLLGGDYISQTDYAQRCFEILGNIENSYCVLGNHDMSLSVDTWSQYANESGITLLNNEILRIQKDNQHINLYGIAEVLNENDAYLNLNKEQTNIVLSHQPDKILEIELDGIDLFMCGHTHGGQVTFFKLYSPYLPTKMKKMFKHGIVFYKGVTMYISSGVGTTFLPFRLFAPAEIVVITLKQKAS